MRGVGDSRKIRAKLQQIENNLKMYVWHPAAVFIFRAHSRKFLSAPNALARFQMNERILGKMPVECEKVLTITRFMLQNDQRSVILRCGIIGNNVDYAIQRRAQPRPRLDE